MEKECIKCGSVVLFTEMRTTGNYLKNFYLGGSRVMTGSVCKACKLKSQRENRAKIGNKNTHKYEKTKSGFLMRSYSNMKSRVTGVQKKKAHLYAGLSLMSRDDFYAFSLSNESFHSLFAAYEAAEYDQRICPSVDRIDSSIGYQHGNIRWITHSENSIAGCKSEKRKLNRKV